MNPFLLAAIGAPLVFGTYLRFKRFDFEVLRFNIQISTLVLLLVGVGYAFTKFKTPAPWLLEHRGWICAAGWFLIPPIASAMSRDLSETARNWIFYGGWYLVGPLLALVYGNGPQEVTAALAAVVALCGVAVANCLLGTISAGFSISATILAFVTNGSVDTVFLWKDVFEFFEISSTPIKVMILVASGLAGAAEVLHRYFD